MECVWALPNFLPLGVVYRCHSTNRHSVDNSISFLNVWRWFDKEIVDNQDRVQAVDGMHQYDAEIIGFSYYYFSI